MQPRSALVCLVVATLACATFGWSQARDPVLEDSQIALCEAVELSASESVPLPAYWDPLTFYAEPSLDSLLRGWYGSQLCALREVPLRNIRADSSLRLLWLRTFHPGAVVRVLETNGQRFLVAKILDGAGGYAPGRLSREEHASLSEAEWNSLLQELDSAGFWVLPTFKRDTSMDGSRWIVEVMLDGRYHVVDRQSGDELRQLGELLLKLSNLMPDPIY